MGEPCRFHDVGHSDSFEAVPAKQRARNLHDLVPVRRCLFATHFHPMQSSVENSLLTLYMIYVMNNSYMINVMNGDIEAALEKTARTLAFEEIKALKDQLYKENIA